jgi:DNA-binding transcriptional regulator GbsR (MarR family)
VDPLTNLFTVLRLPFAAALVLSILIRSGKPLALGELVEATGYAKSHLSSVLRLLEEKSLVERIRVSGRKYLFRARTEGMVTLIREHLSELRAHLRSIADELEDEDVINAVRVLESELHSLLTKLEGV